MSKPPSPKDSWENSRWEHTRLRRRMLTGEWEDDLKAAMKTALGSTSAGAIRDVDISRNIAASVCTALATNYSVAPTISHPDAQAAGLMTKLLENAGFTPTMQRTQRMLNGLREMFIHVSAFATPGEELPCEIALRPVYPDLVLADPDVNRTYEPRRVMEAREICINGTVQWVWTTAEIKNGQGYLYADSVDGEDVTLALFDGVFSGETYPWTTQTGTPVLPYVLYHAEIGPHLWNTWDWAEIFFGCIQAAVDMSAYHYHLRTCAFPQRYVANVELATELVDGRAEVVASPNVILQFRTPEGSTAQPQIGAFPQAFSPTEMMQAIAEYERGLATGSGISSSDLLRVSGDPRSGFALLLDTQARQDSARRSEPALRRADLKLLSTIATIVNSTVGEAILPENSWSISYRSSPQTESEVAARQDRILAQLQAGLISKAEARSKLTGEKIADATAAVDKIKTDTNTI